MIALDFEAPINAIEKRIAQITSQLDELDTNAPEYARAQEKLNDLSTEREQAIQQVYSKLTPWQIAKVARHPMRPYTLDYIAHMVTDFEELHGDRMFADDSAIVGGLGRIDGHAVMIIGHQKGRDTQQKLARNFGMSKPEGYRKANRLAKMAEQFNLPLITFVDTPGAYPGIDAESRGQAEAIAKNLMTFSNLKTPIISTVIGEGGSGGALAIGVCDYLAMLEYSTYSVISPEGCASILWKSAEKAPEAAQAMGLTSADLIKQGLIDEVVPEPLGGSHRDPVHMADSLKSVLSTQIERLQGIDINTLLDQRYQKLRRFGQWQ